MAHSLRTGANVICEKPLVLDPADMDRLIALEAETGRRINTILQLRLHPAIIALRVSVAAMPNDRKVDVDLTYVTSRGSWHLKSWKGVTEKSDGIATNIRVHFCDMLHFVYGGAQADIVHLNTPPRQRDIWSMRGRACVGSCHSLSMTCPHQNAKRADAVGALVKRAATLGANCTIVCGVTIGAFAFVGPGAALHRDVPDFALMLGVPAQQVGWMSAFGELLDLQVEGKLTAVCPHIGDHYQLADGNPSRQENSP